MALSRSAKIWLIVLSVPVVLLVGGAVALKMLFTSERLKGYVVPPLEEATGRTVTLSDISLSIFPSLAVSIDTLTISNSPEAGFSSRPFCRIDRLFLDISLWPLLSGRVEVPTVRLERPVLFMEVTEKGRKNYSGESGAAPAEPGAKSATMTGGALIVSDIRITDGELEYVNRKRDSRTTLTGITLDTGVSIDSTAGTALLALEARADAMSYGSVATPMISNLPVALRQQLVYYERADSIDLPTGQASAGTIPLSVSGWIAHATGTPVINFVIQSEETSITDLLSLVPPEYLKGSEGLEGKGTADIRLSMTGPVTDSTDADLTGLISSTDASIRYASLPKPITNINIVMDFTRTAQKQEFRVTRFTANLGDNPISATLTVSNFADPSMNLAVNAALNLAELRDYYPLEEGTELSGKLKADVKVAGKVNVPKTRKSSGSLAFQGVTVKTAGSSNPVKNLNGNITFNDLTVEARKLTMMIGKSDLDLGFTVRNYMGILGDDPQGTKPSASVTLTSNHLITADLTGEQPAGDGGKGKPSDGKEGLPFPGVDMNVSASIGTLTMEKFELKNVRTALRISGGVVKIDNFSGNTYGGSLTTSGELNMNNPARPTFDLAVDLNKLDAHQMLPEFTSFGNRLFGNLTMNTRIKGTLDDTLGLVPQTLGGDGTVKMTSGKVEGVKVNQTLASTLGLPDLQIINFNDWQNAFTIANGRLALRDLKIATGKTDYLLNGSVGFDGTLDYALTVFLPPETSSKIKLPGVAGFVGQAADLFKDESGRIKLDFKVTGTSDSPQLSLNTESAQKKAENIAKEKFAAEKKKLEEELKKKAGDLLKDIDPFKKKDGP